MMTTMSVFNFMSLDGYFAKQNGDVSWHVHDAEGAKFAAESMQSGNALLFGRVTYEQMASFWPTPAAFERMPAVAEGMSKADKTVFSSTMEKTSWKNTRIVKGDIVEEARRLKAEKNVTILGSGSIVRQLAQAGVIDEYRFMVDPLALGSGRSIFEGITNPLKLELESTRTFQNGCVLLCYRALS